MKKGVDKKVNPLYNILKDKESNLKGEYWQGLRLTGSGPC